MAKQVGVIERGQQVRIIENIYAIAAPAMPFVAPVGDGRVMPVLGATIRRMENGKFLATVFTGERRTSQVLEIVEINGISTLHAAAN